MYRRCCARLELKTAFNEHSMYAVPTTNLLSELRDSPYKEAFKNYWATPVPWLKREYGAKPKPGDPVPLREASTMIIAAKNQHYGSQIEFGDIQQGQEEDYKVLMMLRENTGRYTRDQFVFPSTPVHVSDWAEGWEETLQRLGVHRDEFIKDSKILPQRIAAIRALITEFNLLALPREGGGMAEVNGPPGRGRWYRLISNHPQQMQHLVSILNLPMEKVFKNFYPFVRFQTPTSEKFRFDNYSFILPQNRITEVQYLLPTVGEHLVWVSPTEAIRRFEQNKFRTPSPNLFLLHRMREMFPTHDALMAYDATRYDTKHVPVESPEHVPIMRPELIHHNKSDMQCIVTEGDPAHSSSPGATKYNRIVYIPEKPFGTQAFFINHSVAEQERESIPREFTRVELDGTSPVHFVPGPQKDGEIEVHDPMESVKVRQEQFDAESETTKYQQEIQSKGGSVPLDRPSSEYKAEGIVQELLTVKAINQRKVKREMFAEFYAQQNNEPNPLGEEGKAPDPLAARRASGELVEDESGDIVKIVRSGTKDLSQDAAAPAAVGGGTAGELQPKDPRKEE